MRSLNDFKHAEQRPEEAEQGCDLTRDCDGSLPTFHARDFRPARIVNRFAKGIALGMAMSYGCQDDSSNRSGGLFANHDRFIDIPVLQNIADPLDEVSIIDLRATQMQHARQEGYK
jgi:hypothetical protein